MYCNEVFRRMIYFHKPNIPPTCSRGVWPWNKAGPVLIRPIFRKIQAVFCECWLATHRIFYKHLEMKIILKKEIQFLHFFPVSGENIVGLFHAQTIQQTFRKKNPSSSCVDFLNTPWQWTKLYKKDSVAAMLACFGARRLSTYLRYNRSIMLDIIHIIINVSTIQSVGMPKTLSQRTRARPKVDRYLKVPLKMTKFKRHSQTLNFILSFTKDSFKFRY